MSWGRPRPVLLTLAMVLVAAGCGQGGAAPKHRAAAASPAASGLPTVAQVYARAERSLRAGGVYHERINLRQEGGEYTGGASIERWTDAAHARSRQQTKMVTKETVGEPRAQTTITLGNERWEGPGEVVAATTCTGGDAVTSAVIGCPDGTGDTGPAAVTWATRAGRRVLALTSEVHAESEDATTDTTDVLYLDATTMLPVGGRSDGTINGSEPFHSRTSVVGDFVPLSSLPPRFFDPAALGWKRPDPVASLPTTARVYWLGQTWRPGGGLPDLVLAATQPGAENEYDAVLEYESSTDRGRGLSLITVQLWRRAVWDSQRIEMTAPSCGVAPVRLLGGTATLYCPEKGAAGAFVSLPDAVLVVDAAARQDEDRVVPNPFGTVAGLTAVLRALRAR